MGQGNKALVFLFVVTSFLFLLLAGYTQGINVLNQRIEVPVPDGSGTVAFQLKADPTDPSISQLFGFNITSINFINSAQRLRLWNSVASDCSGSLASIGTIVPSSGLLCFLSNTTSGSSAEFQNSFQFVALNSSGGGAGDGNTGTIALINYNRQACTGIPDLGGSGSFTAPPTPQVSITLAGLQIKFSITTRYLRNETSWLFDFWSFDNAAGGDSADGTGRTCTNHLPANYPSSFSDWWYSGVRATYNNGIDSSITNALNSGVYPNYDTTGTVWSVSAVDCSSIRYEATIPVSRLVGNETGDCHYDNSGLPAATPSTPGSLLYTGTLYVNALRPISRTNSTQGYYRSSFSFPFSFSLQSTVTDIGYSSASWAFTVAVLNSGVTSSGPTPSFTLDLQTTIDSGTLNTASPTVLLTGFALPSYPYVTLRGTIGSSATPTLSRLSDNGNCGVGSYSPCVIQWRMVLPQLSQAQLSGSQALFDTQYAGRYSFSWTTRDEDDVLISDIYVDLSATEPSTNLSQIPVTSSIDFFADKASMTNSSANGMSPALFSSGDKLWVRHRFLVDPSDGSGFLFSLKQAWICYSKIPGYYPSLANGRTGCLVDIPGVVEAANGERYLLYDKDTLASGILDSLPQRVWNWTLVPPTDSS